MNETIAIKKIEWKWKKKSTENRSVAIFHYFMKITRFVVVEEEEVASIVIIALQAFLPISGSGY